MKYVGGAAMISVIACVLREKFQLIQVVSVFPYLVFRKRYFRLSLKLHQRSRTGASFPVSFEELAGYDYRCCKHGKHLPHSDACPPHINPSQKIPHFEIGIGEGSVGAIDDSVTITTTWTQCKRVRMSQAK